jgi:hypothetical protein
MGKECPECRTVNRIEAPYCEACAAAFPRVPPVPANTRGKLLMRTMLSLWVVAVVVIALVMYLRSC